MSWWKWLTRRRRDAKPADEPRGPLRQDESFPRLYDLRLEERRVLDGMPVAATAPSPANDVSIQAGAQADDQAADVFEASAFERDGQSYLQVTVNDQIAYQGKLADIGKLTIHGSGDADKLILDPRAIPLGGLAFDGGGGHDQLLIRPAGESSSAGVLSAANGASAGVSQQVAMELHQQGGSWQSSLATNGGDTAGLTLTGDRAVMFTSVEQVIDQTAAAVRLVRLVDGVDASIANGDSLGWFDVRVDGGATISLTAGGEQLTLATDVAVDSSHSVDLVESWRLGDLTFRSTDDVANQPADSLEVGWRFDVGAGAEDSIAVTGRIDVGAGDVHLAAGQIVLSGSIDAAGGTVRLDGGPAGHVELTGHVSTAAYDAGGVGGSIVIVGGDVRVGPGAIVDASGDAGGGVILLGGDFQGANPDLPNSQLTWLAGTAQLSARAVASGDGGRVIVWSDDVALIHGMIDARGGVLSGDGGFVETSGKGYLEIVRAPLVGPQSGVGQSGVWLIDPKNVVIEAGNALTDVTVTTPPGGKTYTADMATSKIGVDLLVAAITANSVVTVQAEDNITVSTPITFAANTNLFRLLADSDNNGVGTLQIDFAIHTGGGNLDLFGNQVLVNATLNAGDISIQAPGNVSLGASITAGSVNVEASTGPVSIGGALQLNGAVGPGAGPDALHIHAGTTTINAGGSITVLAGGANVNIESNVTLADGVTLTVDTSAANRGVHVSGRIRGNGGSNENLTITTGSGGVQLDSELGDAGGTQRFGDVAITSTGIVTFGNGIYADSVKVTGPAAGVVFYGPVNLNGLVDAGPLSLQAVATAFGFYPGANITVETGGGGVELTGGVAFADTTNWSIDTSAVNGAVTVTGAIRGNGGSNEHVSISTGSGEVQLGGEIGNLAATLRFGDVVITSTGAVTLSGGVYADSVNLVGPGSTATFSGPINLNGLVSAGPNSFQAAAATIAFGSAANITVGTGGGNVDLTGNVTVADGATWLINTASANGAVHVTGTIRGNGGANDNLTVTAGSGAVQLDGEIGDSTGASRFGDLAITSTGAVSIGAGIFADSFSLAGSANSASITGPINLTGLIGTGLYSLQAAATTIALASTTTITIGAGGGRVELTGNVSVADGVTHLIDTSAANGDVRVTGTIRSDGGSNENLSITAGSGAVQLDGEIGNGATIERFGDITITSTGAVTVGGGAFADSLSIAGPGTTAILTGAFNLNGLVGAGPYSLQVTAATVTFGGTSSVNVATGGGDLELTGNVTLADGATVTIDTSAANGDVHVSGTLRGDGGSNENLVVTTGTGAVQLDGEIGDAVGTQRFGDVSLTSADVITLGAGIYADSLAVAGPASSVNFGGPINLSGKIGATQFSLSAAAGSFTFGSNNGVTVNAGGGDVALPGDVGLADGVTLTIDTSTANGNVTITGTVRGDGGANENLTINAGAGAVAITGEIGDAGALERFGDVAITSTTAVSFGAGVYADSLAISGPASTVSFGGPLDLTGLIGGGPYSLQAAASSFSLSAAADITIGAGGGDVELVGNVTVADGATFTIDTTAVNGDVHIGGAIRGDGGANENLTITTGGGDVQLDGEIGKASAPSQRFGDVTITSTGAVTLGGGAFADSIDVSGPATTASFGGTFNLSGLVGAGPNSFQVTATTITFTSGANVTVGAAGGDVTLTGDVTVANGVTATINSSAANGDVLITGTVRGDGGGNDNFTISSGTGVVQIDGEVGDAAGTQRFGDLSITMTGAGTVTLGAGVYADSLKVSGPPSSVSFAGPINLNGTISAGTFALQVAATMISFASTAGVSVGAGGGSVELLGNVSVASGATLTINTSAANSGVHVSGTIRGNGGSDDNLTVTSGSGAVQLDGEIGKASAPAQRFGDVAITSTGAVSLGSGVFADSLSIAGPATTVSFGGAINLNGLVGAGPNSLQIAAGTSTFASGANVTIGTGGGRVDVSSNVAIANGATFTIDTSAVNGNVHVSGTIRGDGGANDNLTITAGSGAVTLDGELGNAAGNSRIGDVALTSTGAVTLGAGVFADSLSIAGPATSVSLGGAVNVSGLTGGAGTNAVQITATTIAFNPGASVTSNASSGHVVLTGSVNVANGATAAITTSAGNGNVSITGTVRGDGGANDNLTITSGSGTVQIGGEIGNESSTQRFGDVSITSTGPATVMFGAGIYADSLKVAGPATSVSFASPINLNGLIASSSFALQAAASTISFAATSGVTVGAGGGGVELLGNVSVANGATLTIDTSAANSGVHVSGTIRGNGGADENLTVTSGSGTVQLDGEIGKSSAPAQRFGDVSITSTGALALSGGVFADSLNIAGPAMTASFGGSINLNGLVGGGTNSLQVAAGTSTFASGANVTIGAGGGRVNVTGDVSIANGATLTIDTSAVNGNVLVTGTVRGDGGANDNLTITAGSGAVQVNGEIGNSAANARFGDVAVMTIGAISLGAGIYADSLSIGATASSATFGGPINLSGLIGAGPNALQVTATTITFNSGASVTSGAPNGDVTLTGNVTISNGVSLTVDTSAGGGDVLVTGTVRGDGGSNENLTINAGSGTVQVNGEIGNAGGTQRFGDVVLASTSTVTLGAGVYADSLSLPGPGGAATFTGPINLNGQIGTGPFAMRVVATTISFAATSGMTIGAVGGDVELLGNVSVANGATLTIDTAAANGDVHVSGTIRGDGGSNESLTVTTGSGAVQLDGEIGKSSAPAQRFGDVAITSTGAVSLAAVYADSLKVTGPANTVTLNGPIAVNGFVATGTYAVQIISNAIVYGSAASVTVAAGGGDVELIGTPSIADGATLTIDTSAVNGDVHLTDPVRGDGGSNENLVITAGSGAVQLDGEIGDAAGLSRFGDVTITTTGAVTFNEGIFADSLKVAGPASIVSFAAAINLNGLVGIGPDSLQVTAMTIAFGAGSSVTIGAGGGDVTLNGNVTVADGTTLTVDTSGANGDLLVTGTVRGDGGANDNLTVIAGSGSAQFDGEIGDGANATPSRFGDVAITSSGDVTFSGGVYADSLFVAGPANSTSISGAVDLNGLIGAGTFSLQINAAAISFGTTPGITIGAGGGDVQLDGNVSLSNGTTLTIDTSAVDGDVHVTGTIRGNGGSDENLTVTAGAGAVQLDGAIGGTGVVGRFGDIDLSSTGPVSLGADVVADSLRISGPATTATLGGTVDLNGLIGAGPDSLQITGGIIQLGLNANVTIGAGGGNVELTGDVELRDGAGITIDTSAANGEVHVTGTLRGDGGANENLAIYTGSGAVQLDGEVGDAGGGQRFGDLAITSTGNVTLGAGVFGDSLQIAGPAVTANLNGPINVAGLSGAGPYSVQVAAGTIAFGAGSSVLVGTGGGDVQLNGNVSVANGATLSINTSAVGGDVAVTGTIRGNGGADENLTINSGSGAVLLSSEIGDAAATERFGDVAVLSTSSVSLNGGVYADSLSVTGSVVSATFGGPIDLNGLIGAGSYSLQVAATTIAFGAASGVLIGAGGGDVELNGNVSVANNATLTIDSSAANGDVQVTGSIRGDGGANENLTVASGAGVVSLDGEIGNASGAQRFGDVTVVTSADVTLGAAGVYAAALDVQGPAGAVRLIGAVDLSNDLSVVAQTLTADAGISTFGGGVAITALSTGTTPSIILHQVDVNGADVVLTSARDVRFLGGDDSIRSTGGGGQFILQPTAPSLSLGLGDETMGDVGISAASLDAIGVGFTDGIVFGASGQTGLITVFGSQTYHDSVTLRADGGADIDFNASVDLTEDGATGADFTIQGLAGGANPTRIEWFGNVTTNHGAVTFIAESLRLRGPAASRIATTGGAIDFSAMSQIDGDASHPAFELDTSGATNGAPVALPDVDATSGGLSRLSINTSGAATGGSVTLKDVTLVAVTPVLDPALLEIRSDGVTPGDVQFLGRVDVEGSIRLDNVGDVTIADTLIADGDVAIVAAKGDVTGTPGGNVDIVSPQVVIDTAGSVGGTSPLETSTQRLATFADGTQGIKIDNQSPSPVTVVALVALPTAPVVLQQTGGGDLTLGDPVFAPISQVSGSSVAVTTDGDLNVVQEVEAFGMGTQVMSLAADGDVLLGDGGRAITHPENSGIAVDAGGTLTVTPGFLFEVGVDDASSATRFNQVPPQLSAAPVEVNPGVDVTSDGQASIQLLLGDPGATLQEQNFRVAVDWAFGRGLAPPLVGFSYQSPTLVSPTGFPFNSSFPSGSPTLISIDYDNYPGPDPTQPIPVSITVSIDPRVQLTAAGASLDTTTTQVVLLRTSGQAFALSAATVTTPPVVPYVIPIRAAQVAYPLVSPSSAGGGNVEFETIEMTASEAQLRQFVLRVVEDVDENQRPLRMSDDIPLPPEVMDKLLDFFAKLPDDRYRIYLISEDGTRQLVKDFVIRRGKAIDLEDLLDAPAVGDERERTPDVDATPQPNDGAHDQSYRLDQPAFANHGTNEVYWPAELQAELEMLGATTSADRSYHANPAAVSNLGASTGGLSRGAAADSTGDSTGGVAVRSTGIATGPSGGSHTNERSDDSADWSERVRETLRQDLSGEWLRLRRLVRTTKGMGAE